MTISDDKFTEMMEGRALFFALAHKDEMDLNEDEPPQIMVDMCAICVAAAAVLNRPLKMIVQALYGSLLVCNQDDVKSSVDKVRAELEKKTGRNRKKMESR